MNIHIHNVFVCVLKLKYIVLQLCTFFSKYINALFILIFLSLPSPAGKLRYTAHGTETAVFSFDSIYLGPEVRYV